MDTGLLVIDWVAGYTAHRAAVVLGLTTEKTLKKKNRCATFERLWRCSFVLSRALDKSKTINSPHEDSNVKPFGFSLRCLTTGPKRLHDELRHFKDHSWHASYIQLHMRIRTRRDGKNIFKTLCRSQNLPCFLFERLFEEVNQLYKERYAGLTHGNFKKNPIPQLPWKRRRILVYQLM